MRKYISSVLGIFLCIGVQSCQEEIYKDELTLWYTAPAEMWEETLPLGNGRLGAMPNGGVFRETIVLNDITLWSGSEEDALNEEAFGYLPEIRRLLQEGKNLEAQEIMYKHFACKGVGSGQGNGANVPYGCFQTLGEINIDYQYPETPDTCYTDYERGLCLGKALAYTDFTLHGVDYKREYFVSEPKDLIVVKLSASKPQLNFKVALNRSEKMNIYSEDGTLSMSGQLENGTNGNGMKYLTQLSLVSKDGVVITDPEAISVKNASEVYLYVSSSTNFTDSLFEQSVAARLQEAKAATYESVKQEHIQRFQEKFNRVELRLGDGDTESNLPVDERLARFQAQDDPGLCALYFHFGRYLMISGTRENTLPLNLQGLWANGIQTPWNGDYHLNINLQMNYWPMEVANLSDLHRPLTDLVTGMIPSGQRTAKTFYNADGWVAHVITNPWKFTAPAERASWGATNTGGAWLCANLWEHFAFTCDTAYLKEIYPALEGASRFFQTNLIEEQVHRWLVTAPSSSPENSFYQPGSDEPIFVCMGPTMDIQIVTELFKNTIQAATVLGKDRAFADSLQQMMSRFPPMQISKQGGYLQEWLEDYEESDSLHRHVSHLYGLYPGYLISNSATPDLVDACRNTLERRGDGGTGWSRAWKINFWARLYNGERAYKLLRNLLKPTKETEILMGSEGGGTYPNLFCAHAPFQIDGNLGGCAGIAEMLIQSHDGFIDLLPAIPATWKNGEFVGLKVRGGGVVDAKWENGKLSKVVVHATVTNPFKIKLPDGTFTSFELKPGESKVFMF